MAARVRAILFAVIAMFFCLAGVHLRADSVVVFNEIMYHPATNEPGFEWIELHNQMSVDVDLSHWSLRGGIEFNFPADTIIAGGGYLVVAIDPGTLTAATGVTNVVGPFRGRLANDGERLALHSPTGRRMDWIEYGVEADWPVAPDGAGVSLAKLEPDSASAPAASWVSSRRMGGTPGKANFSAADPGTKDRPWLVFNEIGGGNDRLFQLELINRSETSRSLDQIVLAGNGGRSRVFGAGLRIASGGLLVLTEADFGWRPSAGDRLWILSPDRSEVWDAVVVKAEARARSGGWEGRWYRPESVSFGETNRIVLRDEIVINEIFYHPRVLPERPAVYDTELLLPLDATWRFNQTESNLPAVWRDPGYDARHWPAGRALLYVEDSSLPGPKNTPLALGRLTYYFRTEFVFTGGTGGLELSVRALVDDGAVFYLNGIEVLRLNLPDGPVTYFTLAAPGVGNAVFSGPIPLPASALVAGTNVLAVEVHQTTPNSSDIVFGAELVAAAQRSPALPFRDSGEPWIELFNRGSGAVDLSGWRLDQGIEFAFPPGSVLAPGGYLVVARDAVAFQREHPGVRVVGNFSGRLSRRSDCLRLIDGLGNPADEVCYFDRKPWPVFADGGGSSLELRDPDSDNTRPETWAASDESGRTGWRTYRYRGVAAAVPGPTRWNEFVVGLLDAGEVWLDDLSVVDSPDGAARQLITNGAFESGPAGWRALGNHGRSRVVPDPDEPANHFLRLVAGGPTEHMHNHVETTLAGNTRIVNGREYEISFRARWRAGSAQVHTRLYFNRLARTTLIDAPVSGGTPGRRNLRFETNIGPTFDLVRHDPPVPAANQPVIVTVIPRDPDGMGECRLWWSAGAGPWTGKAMSPLAGGAFQALVPGQPRGMVIQFYVEASDGLGTGSVWPSEGAESRALVKVDDGLANNARLHRIRIIMTAGDTARLHAATNVMSNELLGATVIYDEREIFYNAGVHLQGSQRGRLNDSRVGFTLRFPADQLFRGVHPSITIDRSGGYSGIGGRHDEILLRQMMNRAGGLPDMYNDLIRLAAPRPQHTGSGMLLMAKHDDEFLESSFSEGSDGTLFKLELIYAPTTTADGNVQSPKLPQPDEVSGVDIQYLGDDQELYRWHFLIENNRARDDYAPLIRLAQAFTLSGRALEERTGALIDPDQWMRAFAVKSLSGDVDTYSQGYPHNQLIYFRPADGKALAFPWDMDYSWTRPVTAALYGEANIAKVISRPANRRLFYGHLLDLIDRAYNPAYLGRWAAHYAGLVGQNYSGVVNYAGRRANYVWNQLGSPVPFLITSNGGIDLLVDTNRIEVRGIAGYQWKWVELRVRSEAIEVTWTTPTNWQATVPLLLGANGITAWACDFAGQWSASNPLTVVSTAIESAGDRDQDGLPDRWESMHGFDPQTPDARSDPDLDGLSNFEEYLAGTDPWNRQSALELELWLEGENSIGLSFDALPGRSYSVQECPDPAAGQWRVVTNVPPSIAGGRIEWRGSAPSTGSRFYRLVIP